MDVRAGRTTVATVALCVTGSIAAYKAAYVTRLLLKAGFSVLPVMTPSSTRFLGPLTLSGLAGEAVVTDMWDPRYSGEVHVDLAARADVVAIVPATADVLARMAQGRADDVVTALAMCAKGPVVAAPAMHPRMWAHPATQRNIALLDGVVTLIGPVAGEVASGESGLGRMAEPEDIVQAIVAALAPRDLAGVRLVVSAGPTLEDVDPVRFLGNRSSGRMGFAIAERAVARGAEVTLVAGPVERSTPRGVRRIDVRGALEMRAALHEALGGDLSGADALVMSAAVADYRPAQPSATKTKKDGERATLELVKNPDLLAEIGHARTGTRPVLVGFALETADDAGLLAYARGKLAQKKIDLVVANRADEALGRDTNRVLFVTEDGAVPLPLATKRGIADALLDRVRALLAR
jgi:phosphopantothenoylcysteine decarboxylase / phosphopantothenate---cysteine ligase